VLWRTIVSPSLIAWSVAPGPGGGAYLTGQFGTARVDGAGHVLWVNPIGGASIASNGADAFVVASFVSPSPPMRLLRLSPANVVVWENTAARGTAVTTYDGEVVTAEPFVELTNFCILGPPLCGSAGNVFGFIIDGFSADDGQWHWGLRHIIGPWTGSIAEDWAGLGAHGGRLVVTSPWQTGAFSVWLEDSCPGAASTCDYIQ